MPSESPIGIPRGGLFLSLIFVLPLLACAAPGSRLPTASVEECATMTPSQFSKPIQGDALRIDDWIGDVPDFEMVVEAPLDAQGYVRNPRVLSSKPAGAPSRDILAAVSTWRFCPQLAKSLGGRPYRIPIAGARQGGVNPAGAF